jgi:hypothetical protein
VLDSIGSLHNVTLTRIAKHRRVLFVEGKDYPLFQKFAKISGFGEVSTEAGLPAVPSDGFSNWTKVRDTAWGIRKILGGKFQMASILDRDFRSSEEIDAIKSDLESELDIALILGRKEIENYLLVPSAVCSALNAEARKRRAERGEHPVCSISEVEGAIMEITNSMRSNVHSQYLARRGEHLTKTGDRRDQATILRETGDWFDEEWSTLDGRIRVAPGKDVLARLRDWAQERFAVTLTTSLILGKLSKNDIAADLIGIIERLDGFRLSRPQDFQEEEGPV